MYKVFQQKSECCGRYIICWIWRSSV